MGSLSDSNTTDDLDNTVIVFEDGDGTGTRVKVETLDSKGRAYMVDDYITVKDILKMVLGSKVVGSDEYDDFEFFLDGTDIIFEFALNGFIQFQVLTQIISQTNIRIRRRTVIYNLLQLNGDYLLQLNNDKIQIQGKVPKE